MTKLARTVGAVAAAVVVVAVGVWMLSSDRGRAGTGVVGLPANLRPAPPSAEPFNGRAFVAAEVRPRIGDALARHARLRALPPGEREQMAAAVATALESLYSGTREQYDQLLRDLGLDPAQRGEREQRILEHRDAHTGTVRGQPVRPDQIDVRLAVAGGKLLQPPALKVGASMMAYTTPAPRGPNDVLDPIAEGTEVAVISLPTQIRAADGTEHAAGFGVQMTRRPSDGRWIVSGFVISDVPEGRPVVVPFP